MCSQLLQENAVGDCVKCITEVWIVSSRASSVCRATKRFCKGISGFGGRVFLLQVLAMASLHSLALFLPLSSGLLLEVFLFGCVLWIPCRFCLEQAVSVLSVFLMLGTFSLPPAVQPPSVGDSPSGHMSSRQAAACP